MTTGQIGRRTLLLTERHSSLAEHYRLGFAIRSFERLLLNLFAAGRLSGTSHSCLGQEVAQVGIVAALDRDRDCMFSNHRCHGHFLAYCGELTLLLAEIMGRPDGVCGGRGGSQHLHYRNFYSNGIQGGIVGNAAGVALAEKTSGSGAVTVVWLGDGTFGEGLVYETMNIASLWSLPMVFLAECNGIAQTTPTAKAMAGTVTGRCAAFGIPAIEVAGDNMEATIAAAAEVIDATRADQKPRCLVSYAERLGPHSKSDDTRDATLIERAWAKDPLAALRHRLDASEAEAIECDVSALVSQTLDSLIGQSPR